MTKRIQVQQLTSERYLNMLQAWYIDIVSKYYIKNTRLDKRQRTSSSHSSDESMLLLYFHFQRVF